MMSAPNACPTLTVCAAPAREYLMWVCFRSEGPVDPGVHGVHLWPVETGHDDVRAERVPDLDGVCRTGPRVFDVGVLQIGRARRPGCTRSAPLAGRNRTR